MYDVIPSLVYALACEENTKIKKLLKKALKKSAVISEILKYFRLILYAKEDKRKQKQANRVLGQTCTVKMVLFNKILSLPFQTSLKCGFSNMRFISTTLPVKIKEIQVKQKANAIIIQGESVPSPRAPKLLKEVCTEKFCPECTLGLELKHTDVLILSQYVRSDGCMLPRRITGLCKRQQRRIGAMVTMAQKAGLMPNLTPANSKKDPKKRYQWKKFNKYFDESTIKY